jgi:hypothetical protein
MGHAAGKPLTKIHHPLGRTARGESLLIKSPAEHSSNHSSGIGKGAEKSLRLKAILDILVHRDP